jgi:SAM-dependent methyltransferase
MTRALPFTDLFSGHAATYASARPEYPDALYGYLAACVGKRERAWDCGTGNGQAARDLARYFTSVIATDASAQQIAHAAPVPGVTYRVCSAETSGIEAHSVDLVAVAQALHWFDLDPFYAEVRRVTVPGGVIAAWSYGSCRAGADVEELLRDFEDREVGPYWHPNRKLVDDGYRTIPFPFPELDVPTFQLRVRWNLRQLGLYLSSWSAVAAYRRLHGEDPVPRFLERIAQHWGAPDAVRDVEWPLALRVGRIA